MATVNYKCPNCGGPLLFNPDKQMFSCEYCMSDFEEKTIQQMFAQEEAKQSNAEREEERKKEKAKKGQQVDEEAVVYNCPSCGAEVVTTASTAATNCFYCQNPVVLGGRLSGEFEPDRIIPFVLTKEKAIDKFFEMCKKKWFLPKGFANKNQFENLTGVYFPYWYIDSERDASMSAKGNKIRTWRVGKKTYTETSTYQLNRAGDLSINNVFERALKNESREMLQGVHPFDLKDVHDFKMSYLSGFQAEKRDIEKEELTAVVNARMQGYGKQLLENTMSGYTGIRVESYADRTKTEKWSYTLLPVWVVTYKYNGKILPFAINGQTGKTYGSLPLSKGKLAILFASVFGGIIALCILGLLGGWLLS